MTAAHRLGMLSIKLVTRANGNASHAFLTAGHSSLRPNGNVFKRFCIVSSNELVVLDSLDSKQYKNDKQYKNAGKRFRV